jgi:hypothetical protein
MPNGGILRRKNWIPNPNPPMSQNHLQRVKARFWCQKHGLQRTIAVEGPAMQLECGCSRSKTARAEEQV